MNSKYNPRVFQRLNNFLSKVMIKPSLDIEDFEFLKPPYWSDIKDLIDRFDDGLLLYSEWQDLKDRIIFCGELLQIQLPITFYSSSLNKTITIHEKTYDIYDKPARISVVMFLRSASRILWEPIDNSYNGEISKIVLKKNKLGIIFEIIP